MASQEPHTLSPSARSAALLVARIIFYNGLLIGLGCCALAVAVVIYQLGNVVNPTERWLVGAVLVGIGIMAFGFAAMARTRIARLKASH